VKHFVTLLKKKKCYTNKVIIIIIIIITIIILIVLNMKSPHWLEAESNKPFHWFPPNEKANLSFVNLP